MLATFPPLEFSYTIAKENPWWISEKYDGIRCCWNNRQKKLYARSGVEIALSSELSILFPRIMLDSEAWFGRGLFRESRHFLQPSNLLNLTSFRVVAFDDPSPDLNGIAFEKRYGSLLAATNSEHPFIIVPSQCKCINRKHLTKSIQFAIEKGAEGIIARKPKSLYEHGKSLSLVKLKASRDKEALVVRTSTKSVTLQLPEGLQFDVDRENIKRRVYPIPGDVVTFSYRNYVNSLPVFAQVLKIRTDVSWPDILLSHARQAPNVNALSDVSTQIITSAPKTYGSYVHAKRKKIRRYFETIAKEKGIDPLVPEAWYSFSPHHFKEFKGAMSLLSLFGGSVVNALTYLFPEIGLDPFKFEYFYYSFWNKVENRRAFFENLAQDLGFDPLISENWYPFTIANINNKRARDILRSHYESSLPRAVMHLFPEVKCLKRKFAQVPRNYYPRLILDKFAKAQGFDPLVGSNWRFWDQEKFVANCKHAETVLLRYKSFHDALVDSYPDARLDFVPTRKRSSYWENSANRKLFFDEFAKSQNFDPLVRENWYSVTRETILQHDGGVTVLKYYQNLRDALTQIYPHIGLDFTYKFRKGSKAQEFYSQKSFFDAFAKKSSFDPLHADNWYSVSRDRIAAVPGGNAILSEHSSLPKALAHVYPDIGLNVRKFKSLKNFWNNEAHRRDFFIDFAKRKKFDPLVPENWYSCSFWDIQNHEKATSVLHYYHGNFKTALIHLFPNIGLDPSKFV
eukprot:Phypoly_transcript_02134.p1 GENE.Phypoly_transcript_02134~~Phypoly_transcript_02134.p1  ORF type:complete len:738 (+),score=96.58 Phypoly_transcript_02134:691-2904(+)